jgi:hypothetical protein
MAFETTPEEAVVRNTYAKLSYAVDLNTAYRIVQVNPKISPVELASQVELQGLRFKLSDFTVGNLADVADAKYADAFPPYDGDRQDEIHTAVETDKYGESAGVNYQDRGVAASMETATAKWGPAPIGKTPDWSVGQMIPELEREIGVSPLLRFCSFTVTVTLAGRSRTYRASFLFGQNGKVAPVDPVAGIDGNDLAYFLQHSVYPDVLLRGARMSESPAIRGFLDANQRSGASCKSGDACCDAETLQCGVFSADLLGRRP